MIAAGGPGPNPGRREIYQALKTVGADPNPDVKYARADALIEQLKRVADPATACADVHYASGPKDQAAKSGANAVIVRWADPPVRAP